MKYKVNIPEGCKVMTVEVIDDRIILQVDKENQHQEFKENDIVYTEYNNHPCISIIKDTSCNYNSIKTKCSYNIDKCEFDTNAIYTYDTIRLATDSEKQLLFDKLKEKCLMFDGENIVRWRAGRFKEYYSVYGSGLVSLSKDAYIIGDEHERRYNIGNYFPTKELAEQFKQQYIDLLNNFHKNL